MSCDLVLYCSVASCSLKKREARPELGETGAGAKDATFGENVSLPPKAGVGATRRGLAPTGCGGACASEFFLSRSSRLHDSRSIVDVSKPRAFLSCARDDPLDRLRPHAAMAQDRDHAVVLHVRVLTESFPARREGILRETIFFASRRATSLSLSLARDADEHRGQNRNGVRTVEQRTPGIRLVKMKIPTASDIYFQQD